MKRTLDLETEKLGPKSRSTILQLIYHFSFDHVKFT